MAICEHALSPARLGRAGGVALAVVATAASALAQSDAPVIIGSEQRLQGLQVDYVRFAFEVFAQRVLDQTESSNGPRIRDTEDLVRETVEMSTKGSIGHRNFITFDLTGRLRLSEEHLKSDSLGRDERTVENLNEFNATAVILGQSRLPLTLFARRDQALFNRAFGGTLDSRITEAGARLAFQSQFLPNQIEYFHRTQIQDDPSGTSDFNLTQDTVAWHGQFRPDPNQILNWSYTVDLVDEVGRLRPKNSFTRQDAVATHTLDFGPNARHNLRSDLRFFKETGRFSFERIRWNEILRLRQSANLETRFEYVFDRQTRAGFDQTFNRGTVRIEHQLYESLSTIAEVGGSNFHSTDGDFDSQEWFGRVDMQYDKRVPLGHFTATLDLNVNWRDDGDRGGTVQVTNNTSVFNAAGLSNISQRNVNIGSLVVTDPNGVFVFIEGIDYTVRQFGDRVELRLIPGGNIAAGQSVLVDYAFMPDPANTTLTTSLGGSLRYTLDEGPLRGLAPFVRYFQQAQNRDSNATGLLPEADIDDLIFGVDYDVEHLSLRAQREIHNSDLSPFRATLLEARYTMRIAQWSSLSVNARYDDIDHTDEQFRTQITSLAGRWNGRLTDKLRGSVVLIFRDERDTAGINSVAFEQRLDLTWRLSQTEIFASIRNALVNSDTTDSISQVFMIGLRREF